MGPVIRRKTSNRLPPRDLPAATIPGVSCRAAADTLWKAKGKEMTAWIMTRSRGAAALSVKPVNLRYPRPRMIGEIPMGRRLRTARMRRSFWLTEEEAASATGSAADVDTAAEAKMTDTEAAAAATPRLRRMERITGKARAAPAAGEKMDR
jgi:hypothetical protein